MHTTNDTATLVEVQKQIEQESMELGARRYQDMMNAQGDAATVAGQVLLRKTILDTRAGIQEWLDQFSQGTPLGKDTGPLAYFLGQFDDLTTVAYVVGKTVVNSIRKQLAVQSVALKIAKTLEELVNYDALQKTNPVLWKKFLRKVETTSSQTQRWMVLRRQQEYAGLKQVVWGRAAKLRLGMLLITIFQQRTGMVEVSQKDDVRSPPRVHATPEILEWLEKSHARCALLDPVYKPMVVPPRPWTSPFSSPYLTQHCRVRIMRAGRPYLEELKHVEMPRVYQALNAIQATPWRINTGVLGVLEEVWGQHGTLGGLPHRDPIPLPAKDFPDGEVAKDDPRLLDWKRKAAMTYEENARAVSKRVALSCQIQLANEFKGYEAIYFPHSLDWRGRIYPIPTGLTPQGNDVAKALLQFSEGRPLGTNGAWWLAIHGANCAGVDKVSFTDRVQWVQDHEEDILDSAMRPLDGKRLWAEMDSPYCFLAFCREWAALAMWCQSGRPVEEFVSHLPVQLDGSCNGLQNFSAMLRDEVGGKATNLLPSDKPADIYAAVAVEAQKLIDADAAAGDEQAARWVGRMSRKLSKRNTMTLAYGVTRYGMTDQMAEELKKMHADDPTFRYEPKDAGYIAGKNWEAVGRVVVAATRAMQWLQKVASVASKDGLPIRWTSPVGLMVQQDYREVIGERIEMNITGRRLRLTLAVEGTAINRRKMASGISPNFVHSLDAAHLMATVNLCTENGIGSFSMIHDSYGTHAGQIDALSQALREAFVQQYSGDVLADFREEIRRQLPEELADALPPVPEFGTLDLEAVRQSDYFFA